MKKISILGSTGSIGINALNVIDNLAGQFDVVALSANKNGKRLVKLAKKYPKYSWHKNFGYGTNDHLNGLKKYGITKHHRKKIKTNKKQI